MRNTALVLLAVLASPLHAVADAGGIPWEGSKLNCDGSRIQGMVTYALYVNENPPAVVEGATTSDPCTADTGNDGFWGQGTPVEEGDDLCEFLDSGKWYISMTATTERDERSNYSRPVRVQIERDQDNVVAVCHVIEQSI